jgi:metal-responsive CopG/Arc/MetJ family transcriptional regulator
LKEYKVSLSITIDDSVMHYLRNEASETGKNRSTIVNKILKEYFEKREKEKELNVSEKS